MTKRNKYNNRKIVIDGNTFDSEAEGRHYVHLMDMARAGKINGLELQPEFKCKINGKLMFTYRADFAYFAENSRRVIDVKGFKTPIYKLKKKIVQAMFPGVEIIEVA